MGNVKKGESVASRIAHIIYPTSSALPNDTAHSQSNWMPKRSSLQSSLSSVPHAKPFDCSIFSHVESWKIHVMLCKSLVVRSGFARFCHGQQLLSLFFIRCSLIQPWQVGLPANSHDTWFAISRAGNSQLFRPTCEQSPRLRCDIGKIKCSHNRPNLPCIN